MKRSNAPANTTPPAVASTPDVCGARSRVTHTVLRVSILIACTRPYLPSLSGRGRIPQLTPEDSAPRPPPPGIGKMSMQASVSGANTILLAGLYDAGG